MSLVYSRFGSRTGRIVSQSKSLKSVRSQQNLSSTVLIRCISGQLPMSIIVRAIFTLTFCFAGWTETLAVSANSEASGQIATLRNQ